MSKRTMMGMRNRKNEHGEQRNTAREAHTYFRHSVLQIRGRLQYPDCSISMEQVATCGGLGASRIGLIYLLSHENQDS